jgi:hypothetical protein
MTDFIVVAWTARWFQNMWGTGFGLRSRLSITAFVIVACTLRRQLHLLACSLPSTPPIVIGILGIGLLFYVRSSGLGSVP